MCKERRYENWLGHGQSDYTTNCESEVGVSVVSLGNSNTIKSLEATGVHGTYRLGYFDRRVGMTSYFKRGESCKFGWVSFRSRETTIEWVCTTHHDQPNYRIIGFDAPTDCSRLHMRVAINCCEIMKIPGITMKSTKISEKCLKRSWYMPSDLA